MGLTGLQITTNITQVTKEFDKLISHINQSLNKPFNLNLNINQIQRQMQQVNQEAIKLGQSISSSMSGTGNSNGLDRMTTTTRTLAGEVTAMGKTIQEVRSSLGETVTITTKLDAENKQVGATVVKTTENYKAQRDVANSIQEAIAKTIQQRELENKVLEETQAKYINKALEENNQEKLKTAEIEKQITLYKEQANINLQNLNRTGGNALYDTGIIKQIEDYKIALNSLNSANPNFSQLNNQFKQIQANVKDVNANLKEASSSSKGFGDNLVHDFGAMLTWSVVATGIFGTINAIKQALETVKELDDTINDLKMDMMSTSQTAFDGLVQSSRNLSIALGSNISDIDAMMQVYSNANTTVDEIMAKTKPAAILSNITDMSATESVDAIQAILLQFDQFKKSSDDVATQATHVTDVLASVGQSLNINFKTGISDISEAIKVSGEVINEAGISYEKYAGIVGKVAEIQRISGSTIGNAMKTIASRISRANSGDATADDISAADKAYKSIGINVRDATGNFKDLDTTLTSLGNVWGSLNSVQKSYIAEQSAGVNFCLLS